MAALTNAQGAWGSSLLASSFRDSLVVVVLAVISSQMHPIASSLVSLLYFISFPIFYLYELVTNI